MTPQGCAADIDDPFRCPTKWELWRQILALLPRGRAWQTHEDAPDTPTQTLLEMTQDPGPLASTVFAASGDDLSPRLVRSDERVLTVMAQYWAAYAEVLEFLHQRACALIAEFFCATMADTAAEWGADYGYPDTCAPWHTLCDKVRAVGGSSCAYLSSLAAQLGYYIECVDCPPLPANTADCLTADLATLCQCTPNLIYVRIPARLNPGLAAPTPFAADALVADCTAPCALPPDLVVCLIERFKPAHVKAIYEVIP